jgi:hypothetical protein
VVRFVVPDPYARIVGTFWPSMTVVKAERSEFIWSLTTAADGHSRVNRT